MRQIHILRLLSGAALMALASFASAPHSFAEETPAATETKPFDVNSINSFSGAFLAARTADVDRDLDVATKLYRTALEFQPDNVEVKQRLMITLLMNGQFQEGVKVAEQLKSDGSVERITTVTRAVEAIRKREYRKAEKLLVYNGPNDLDRLLNGLLIGWAKAGSGNPKDAIASIQAMEGPEWFAIFKNYHEGAIALAAGDKATARSKFNDAVLDRNGGGAAPDTFLRAVTALARLEARDGNKQKALDAIAVGENFLNNYAPLSALRTSIEKGQPQEQQVRDAAQGAAAVLFTIGAALNREGAEDIVSLYLQSARALDPDSADILVMLGGVAETLKKPEQAIELYKSVPEGSPMRRLSEMQLGLALASIGKVEESKKHLKGLLELDPKDIRSYVAYGSVLSDAKDYKEMAHVYDQAVESIGPLPQKKDWSIFFQRGIAYERLKEWAKAEPNFTKALELNPDQPQVLNYLGYSWVDMNINLDKGLEMIRKAVELKPDDGYIVDSLGWAYFRMNRFDDAVSELERAAELLAGDPTINDHLGDAYWRVGRKLEAVFQWNQTLELKPEEAEIPKIKAKIENGLPALKENVPSAADAEETLPKKADPVDTAGKKS
ncbi:tetratricopeptide (TPR) repeat protein [Pararhizobium capsulatum DSM 1112]|uniref:Tetratricopeptide (TPR) repeat protein n=1 Tax=Pararhizobium capsulatum DSM 1112 TaxID=1121113 RepID=A0ABU0BM88_9HYPH|nr:tetratricopeptide repeat protein [Pararhizobium capsulatum]MDQ0319365.1 tetratricopeptide (TPR) repeat protein [Pararhizobium capsulatum DSM 1112]